MTRHFRRSSPRSTALALAVPCLLVLAGCGAGQQQQPGLVLEPVPGRSTPAASPFEPVPEADACFEVAGAYTALMLLPLSTDEADPDFHPHRTAASVQELAAGLPADLHPVLDDAVVVLGSAGGSLQPAELADLQRALAPIGDWLQRHCGEPTPTG